MKAPNHPFSTFPSTCLLRPDKNDLVVLIDIVIKRYTRESSKNMAYQFSTIWTSY